MAETAQATMSVDEFFVWQDRQDELYELVNGRAVPRAMTGATQRHDDVVVNAIIALGNRLRGGPCRPRTADIAVRTKTRSSVRRPDLTVDCGPSQASSLESHEPVMILEVLSPSTEKVDTLIKLDEYKALPTLRHILIAEPTSAHVLVYSRGSDGIWTALDHIGLDTLLDLPAISCTLPLADLYEGIQLDDEAIPA